jgi:hypothetical protein
MSNKSKTSAARTAQPVPVPAGGPLPAAFASPISAFQFFSVSAFASVTLVTLSNSYGTFYKHQNNPNPISAGTSIFTMSCNKPGDEPVTLVTLP